MSSARVCLRSQPIALVGQQIDKSRGGWTFNLDPEIRRLDATARSENIYRRACSGPKNIARSDEACTFGRPRDTAAYDMAIFGDSHADHYTPAMSVLAQRAGMSGRQITVGGCLALLGYYEIVSPYATEARCRSLRDAVLRFVEENPRLQVAVLAHHWSIYMGKTLYQDEGKQPFYLLGSRQDERSEQRSLHVLQQSLEQTIDLFEQRGIHVVLLGEVPPLGRDPIKCIAAAVKRGLGAQGCRRPASEVQQRLGAINRQLADLARRRKQCLLLLATRHDVRSDMVQPHCGRCLHVSGRRPSQSHRGRAPGAFNASSTLGAPLVSVPATVGLDVPWAS